MKFNPIILIVGGFCVGAFFFDRNVQAIPKPATYAMALSVATLGIVLVRSRQKKSLA